MANVIDWNKIRSELNKMGNLEKIKAELKKIGDELSHGDYHSILTPAAMARVKRVEKKYSALVKSAHKAQVQLDREVNRILRQVKSYKSITRIKLQDVKDVAEAQKKTFIKSVKAKAKQHQIKVKRKVSGKKRTATRTATAE